MFCSKRASATSELSTTPRRLEQSRPSATATLATPTAGSSARRARRRRFQLCRVVRLPPRFAGCASPTRTRMAQRGSARTTRRSRLPSRSTAATFSSRQAQSRCRQPTSPTRRPPRVRLRSAYSRTRSRSPRQPERLVHRSQMLRSGVPTRRLLPRFDSSIFQRA